MFIGIDDTDSPAGGCTTHFALEAAAAFRRELGLVLRARPRLVRLNPNIPWKTRGNAAVALELGRPSGGGTLAGVALDGTEIQVDRSARAEPASPAQGALLDALVAQWCDLAQPGTDPAYIVADERPPATLYEQAVKGVVNPADVRGVLERMERPPIMKALGDGRGIVGAAAAVAYPADAPTFEITVYRERARWGTKRAVDIASVDVMDRTFGTTFNNIDRRNKHAAVAPATPCPVLFGVRAFAPGELQAAAASVAAGEAWGGWIIFETNQGTDAHVVDSTVARAAPPQTVRVEGEVASAPRRVEGGHVVFALSEGGSTIDCAAYEPTKEFRDVAEALAPGDRVRAVGAVREGPRTLNLEKIEVLALSRRRAAPAGQACPACGATMKSSGAGGPLRCPACGAKTPRAETGDLAPPLARGWYEAPVSARRHLSRPVDGHVYGPPQPAPKGEP